MRASRRHYPKPKTGLLLGASLLIAAGLATSATAQSPCTCRAAGVSYPVDACICLNTPDGPRRACCGKVLNNSAWKFTGEQCPAASLQLQPGLHINTTSLAGLSTLQSYAPASQRNVASR